MIISFIWFNKLVRSAAVNATWALVLGTLATSNNRQRGHRQLGWMQLKPSPIAMDAINAIIVSCQSAHMMSLSNATRKAVAINLEATRRPCQQMQQGHCEGIVRVSWVSQWYSYRNDDYHRWDVNHCNTSATKANCHLLQTSAGATGCMLDAMMATSVTVSMADVSSTSSALTSVAATNKCNDTKSPPHCKDKDFKPCRSHGKRQPLIRWVPR